MSSAKIEALEDITDAAVSEKKKIVVIARFIPEIKEICKMLERRKIIYSICGGERPCRRGFGVSE